jgi:single-strand selective monofunctional uracil DNA glycosylase
MKESPTMKAMPTSGPAASYLSIMDALVQDLGSLEFSDPVTHIYNPLVYARTGFDRFVKRYGKSTKEVILVGMNPGPFGMAQTGVPFGDVEMVKGWLGIYADVDQPATVHPKRPIAGYRCPRGEVSGKRLWGWAGSRWQTADAFFESFFVINYCPLVFMEASGRNRTPDRLPVSEKRRLFYLCDMALRRSIAVYRPRWVVGIGGFAERRAREALAGYDLRIGRITHPSPANPVANRGWAQRIEVELAQLGIELPPDEP